jgi:hypothetical protein
MSYVRPIATPANARATDYARPIYAEQSGANLICYTEDDLFSTSIPAALGTNLVSTSTPVHARFLGIHCNAINASKLTVALARSHDMAPRWSQMNPSDGVFVDAGMGAWLDAMKARGAETIYTIFHTPTWLSARPSETGDQYGSLGSLAEPSNMAKLGAFVTWMMTTYGNRIDYLETWNEPKYNNSGSSYFSGTPAKLAEMAKVIYQAAKAVKPSLTIMGVGCTGLAAFDGTADTGITYTSQFLEASDGAGGFGKNWIDILSVHTYMHDGTNNVRFVPNMKTHLDTIKATSGISSMRVWSTEWGYITPFFNTYTGPPASKILALVRFALQHVAAGMDRCVMYAYDRPSYSWLQDPAADAQWNRWCDIINGSTISVINRISARGELACVINGQRYIV